jgi:hypothetical protein
LLAGNPAAGCQDYRRAVAGSAIQDIKALATDAHDLPI